MAYLTYIGSTYKTFSCLNVPKYTSGVTKAKCYKYNSYKDVSFHFVLYGMFCLIFVPLLQEITDRANSTGEAVAWLLKLQSKMLGDVYLLLQCFPGTVTI